MKKLLLILLISLSFSSYGGSQLDFTLSDFCYQQPNVQDRGGVYYFPNESEGITASSLCVYKDLYGQYMSKVELLNGQFDGKETSWYENGQMRGESNYKGGKKDGEFNWWRSDGLKWIESVFSNNVIVSCEYLNESLPWDLFAPFTSVAECPNPKPLPKGITLGDEIVSDQLEAQAEIQYRQLLAKEVQDEEDIARSLMIEDQLNMLQNAYINNIAARIKTFWRYQSAEDDWTAEVYVVQDRDGNVKAVDVKNANVGNSSLGKSFMDSIERAVNKASPFPRAPDDAVFDSEIYLFFSVN